MADNDKFRYSKDYGTLRGYYKCDEKDLVTPSEIDGTKITEINSRAFNNEGLTSVVIADSVVEIGVGAFMDNKLISVALPKNLKKIDYQTFRNNKLIKLNIPKGVVKISTCAFENNELTSIIIPNTVTEMCVSAFKNNKLKSVKLSENLEVISACSFENNEIESLIIPKNVREIERAAFMDNKLKSITISSNSKIIGSEALKNNELIELIIEDGVEEIKSFAFANNKLTSITIPSSVSKIEKGAFENNSITSITIECNKHNKKDRFNEDWVKIGFPAELMEGVVISNGFVFDSNTGMLKKYIGNEKKVIIPNEINGAVVKEIGFKAFFEKGIEEAVIPEAVESIGEEAFNENNLKQLEIPKSVKLIEKKAFRNNQLEKITIPDNVKAIGAYAFCKNNLVEVVIPSSLRNLNEYVFAGNNLTTVTIPESVFAIKEGAFFQNELLAINISFGVSIIEKFAFQKNNLVHVEIPKSVKKIERYAFTMNPVETVKVTKDTLNIENCFPDVMDVVEPMWLNRKMYSEEKAVDTLSSLLLCANKEEANDIMELLSNYPSYESLFEKFIKSKNQTKQIAGEYLLRAVKANKMIAKTKDEQIEFIKNSVSSKSDKKIEIFDLSKLPSIYFNDGTKVNDEVTTAILALYLATNDMLMPPENKLIEAIFNYDDLKNLGKYVVDQWESSTDDNKIKTALVISTYYSDEKLAYKIKSLVDEMFNGGRYKVALQLIEALGYNGAKISYMLLDDVANRGKTKRQKEIAKFLLRKAARNADVSLDSMLDMIVPDFGFDEMGALTLSADNGSIDILLNEDGKLNFRDSKGKVTKTLPKSAESFKKEVNAIKKQITTIVKNQTSRLEMSHICGKMWNVSVFVDLFINNPLVRQISKGLVFGSENADGTKVLFTVNKERTLETANYDEVNLSDLKDIYLMHSVEETFETLSEWKTYLKDNELKPNIDQLSIIEIYTEFDDEYNITKYNEAEIDNKKETKTFVREIVKAGFTKDEMSDNYLFDFFMEFDSVGIRVELNFEYGIYMLEGSKANESKVSDLSFYNQRTKVPLKLNQVPKRLIATVVHKLDKVFN